MSHELQTAILATLDAEPRSTKALMCNIDGFNDRDFASRFLHDLSKQSLIKKQSNGYWRCTAQGIAMLHGMEIDTSVQQHALSEVAEATESKQPPLEDQPRPEQLSQSSLWQAAAQLRSVMPANASLVIEQDRIIFVLAGNQFDLQKATDIDAALNLACCHIGKISA